MAAVRLPDTDFSPLLRTDFTDDEAWQALLEEVGEDWVTVMADVRHRDLTAPELVALVPDSGRYPVLVVADDVTFSAVERSFLLIDVKAQPGRTFRVVADAFRSVIGNLAIDNRSFDDYLDSVDDSGVYRLSDRHRQAMNALQASSQSSVAVPHSSAPGPGIVRGRPGRSGAATAGEAAQAADRLWPGRTQ